MSRKEARQVGSFSRLCHRGVGEVFITQGDRVSVEVEAPEHMLPRLVTEVSGDTLTLSFRHDWLAWLDWMWHWSFGPLRFHVTARDLSSISLSGAGNMTVSSLKTDRLEITLNGAGNVRIDSLTANELKANLRSVGNLEVSGRVENQDVTLNGAGNFGGSRLESKNARVRISGVGNGRLWVRESLDAQVNGVGNVEFYGSPRVVSHVNGLGNVRHLGER